MTPTMPNRYPRRSVALMVAVILLMAIPVLAQQGGGSQTGAGEPAASLSEPVRETAAEDGTTLPWWAWSLILFVFCFAMGILAVMAGVGGGVLYVPLVAGFFPFHIDFVRATGLLIALSGALAAGPGLLKARLASLRLALPCALFASLGGVAGALIGLRMDPSVLQIALGVCVLAVVLLMLVARNVEIPEVLRSDRLSAGLNIGGAYFEESQNRSIPWRIHRTPLGLVMFIGVGFVAGMFGLGAGWASVPVLNLVMGVPLKLAVGSSVFMISINGAAAAWIYLNGGCWMPVMAVPSILGLMLGTSLGVKLLGRSRPRSIRYVIILVMVFAGVRSLLRGLGVWP
ncbi:MAG: sulfite exporter TauE/SafE family protein [Planctomycetes bacterium]|nr:sulfite exporter TauE/SafE family protein [Planctomycetota bacterium]